MNDRSEPRNESFARGMVIKQRIVPCLEKAGIAHQDEVNKRGETPFPLAVSHHPVCLWMRRFNSPHLSILPSRPYFHFSPIADFNGHCSVGSDFCRLQRSLLGGFRFLVGSSPMLRKVFRSELQLLDELLLQGRILRFLFLFIFTLIVTLHLLRTTAPPIFTRCP